MGRTDDAAWIHAALAQHERPLTLYALRLTGDLERARDVVQEAFLRLCEQKREDVAAHTAEWLFTVCRNLALDVLRKESRMTPLTEERTHARPSPTPPPGAELERADSVARVLEAMIVLPTKQQEALRLKFQQGLSYAEIAGVMNEKSGTVGWWIHAGLRTLRSRLVRGESMEQEGAQA
jgi:RNA polymerase sigma-70 factor (ECF subfamily)